MFGPHVNRVYAKPARRGARPPITAHIEAAREVALDANFQIGAVQVFVTNPHRRAITLRPEEEKSLRAYVEETGMRVYAHGSYADFPWHGNTTAQTFIKEEMRVCGRSGIAGLVVHLGRPSIDAVVQNLPTPSEPDSWGNSLLFLETPHVKPPSEYSSPEGLAQLFAAIAEAHGTTAVERYGVCIDTAHLWSCGVDIRGREAAEDWLRRLEAHSETLPPGRQLIHLNDSKVNRGAGTDIHAALGEGTIWRSDTGGLAAFVEYAVRWRVPVILERKPPAKLLDDYRELKLLGVRG